MIDIIELLTLNDLLRLNDILSSGRFVSGKYSAGHKRLSTKNNLQLDPHCSAYNEAKSIIVDKFECKIRDPHFSLYKTGMYYRKHMDASKMGDITPTHSCTIFLNEDYTGGELILYSDEIHVIRERPGIAVIYPANLLHEVKPIISGERRVVVTWLEK